LVELSSPVHVAGLCFLAEGRDLPGIFVACTPRGPNPQSPMIFVRSPFFPNPHQPMLFAYSPFLPNPHSSMFFAVFLMVWLNFGL
jgi:hypothetical protein